MTPVFKKDATTWRQWRRSYSWLKISPDLKDIKDPIPFLQIFAEHIRARLLFAQGQPTKKQSVEQYLCSISQIFVSVGANNSRHNQVGELDFLLWFQLASYQNRDYSPTIVRPLPVSVIQDLDTAAQGTTPRNIVISNLTWIDLFFLLWPGKYCRGGTDTDQHLFRLKDVQFFNVQQPYNSVTASNAMLAQADFVSLLFTTQKNGVKGESIRQGCTGHPQGCPVAAMFSQVVYLWRHGVTSETLLSSLQKLLSKRQAQKLGLPRQISA